MVAGAVPGCRCQGGRGHRAPASQDAAPPAPPDAAPVTVLWYRAVIRSDWGGVPFFLSVPSRGRGTAHIKNGSELLDLPAAWSGNRLTVRFPVFGTTLRFVRHADGSLAGSWKPSRMVNGTELPVVAMPIAAANTASRFSAETAGAARGSNIDVSGTWRVKFARAGVGKGTFTQVANGVVTGTLIPERVGDLRFLAGAMFGHTLLLSTFDGQHALLLRAVVGPAGKTMRGAWLYPYLEKEPFTAKRVKSFDDSVLDTLRMRKGVQHVTLPVDKLDKPPYRGKPVVVDLFGTWCPGCMDETPTLVDLYHRYHPKGVEFLSLAYELPDDSSYVHARIAAFRKRYGVTWEIAIVRATFDQVGSMLPPELTGIGGFPVTLFIDRHGIVRAAHSGFDSAADPEAHARVVGQFQHWAEEIADAK